MHELGMDAPLAISKPKRILIVDDEPSILRRLKVNLELQGYEVETAESGALAIERIKENKPDLLVIDLLMPEIDGFELISHIQSSMALADIPVVLLAPFAPDRPLFDTAFLEKLKVGYVIAKPFSPKEVQIVVSRLLTGNDVSDYT